MVVDPERARRRVLEERARILRLLQRRADEDGEQPDGAPSPPRGTDQPNPVEVDQDRAIAAGHERELAELDAALARIDAGTYGTDEETGEPIDPERLDVFPAARTNARAGRAG